MDIQLEKKELMKLLKETESPSVLIGIRKVFQKEKKDWYEELPDFAKQGIEAGLDDLRNGRVVSFEEVKKQLGWK